MKPLRISSSVALVLAAACLSLLPSASAQAITALGATPAHASSSARAGTGSIVGTLTTSTGEPQDAAVAVEAYGVHDDGTLALAATGYYDPGYDGGPGGYRVDDLRPGTYRLYFYRSGDQTGFWWPDAPDRATATDIVVADGETVTRDATSELGATISGAVTALGHEQSSAIFPVRLDSDGVWRFVPDYDPESNDGVYSFAFSDSGRYTIRGLQPGTYRMLFDPVGYSFETLRNNPPIARSEWWRDATSLETATDVVVGRAASVTGVSPAVTPIETTTRRPRITGRPVVGRTLTVSRGTWRSGRVRHYRVTWFAGERRLGEHGRHLRVRRPMLGSRIHAVVWARTPGWAAGGSATSETAHVRH